MVDAGPPLVLMAIGLVLWLAVTATLAGISIQVVGMILFFAGLLWLVIELFQSRSRRTTVVRSRTRPPLTARPGAGRCALVLVVARPDHRREHGRGDEGEEGRGDGGRPRAWAQPDPRFPSGAQDF